MTIDVELVFKFLGILATIASSLFGYHKYIMTQLEKKVDKTVCDHTHTYIKEIREENNKTLFNGIKKIEERLGRIEEHLLNKELNHDR